jgi:hypothetical protein
MPDFSFLMFEFPTADAAEHVATTLSSHDPLGRFHMTHVGPTASEGSLHVKLLGADPEPAEAGPGAWSPESSLREMQQFAAQATSTRH